MAGLGATSSKRGPQGRSVEEVILMRKLGDTRVQLPAIKTSQSSGSLPVVSGKHDPLPPSTYQPSRQRASTTKEVLYTESDVRRMMEEVTQFTRALQNRVQYLEEELLATNHGRGTRTSTAQSPEETSPTDVRTSKAGLSAPALSGAPVSHAAARHKAVSLAHDAILNIDSKVLNLKDIFRRKDPLEERYEAAVRIQAVIRRYLVLSRKRAFTCALRDWRWQRCRPVVWLLDILLSNQSKLDTGFHLLRMNRTMRTLLVFFGKWAFICRQNAPLRLVMRENAADKIEHTRLRLLRRVFQGLRDVSVGSLSTKKAILERRLLIDRIRSDLSGELQALGLVGVVPEDEVFRVLHRKVVEQFHERKKVLIKRFKFQAMVRLVAAAKRNETAARRERFRRLAGRCFYAWSDYVYLKSRGLDRKRWPGPRKYEVRYNQKRVDHFARIRCERFVFCAWKAYFSVQLQVKRRFQAKKAAFAAAVFRGWRQVAAAQRVLRRGVYDNWKGYARLITSGPFQAWADYVCGLKNQYNEHLRIAKAYRRWKLRQRLFVIVKTWRHQALFGRVDGLYTRQMLLKSLGEQKIFASSLEKHMADQLLELEDCKKTVAAEVAKRQAYEADISRLNAEVNKTRMTVHHYEQELKRMQSTLQTLATINPKHVDHIGGLQGDFKFKERHIALGGGGKSQSLLLGGGGGGGGGAGPGSGAPALAAAATTEVVPAAEGAAGPALEAVAEHPQAAADAPPAAAPAATALPSNSGPGTGIPVPDPVPLSAGEEAAAAAAGEAPPPPSPTASPGRPPAGHADTPASPGPAGEEAAVSAEDRALLVRVRWLLGRYEAALPAAPHTTHLVLAPARPHDGHGHGDGDSLTDSAAMDDASQPRGGPLRGSLLRPAAPSIFARNSNSSSIGGGGTSSEVLLPPSPTRRLSVVRRPSAQASASAASASFLAQAMHTAVQAATSSVAPGDYYRDDELEDLVIGWAKMLVAFFDFLAAGDLTGLPAEDKRLWAAHLLARARGTSSVEPPAAPATAEEALHTVDQQLGGTQTWRQALLTLRTMFPGSGNFSGLGVPLTAQEDVSFGQRVLQMQRDLQAIEAQAAAKHQRRFVAGHLPPTPVAEADALAMSVYASNLPRLAQLQEEREEAARRLLSVQHTLRAALPLVDGLQEDGAAEGAEGAEGRPGGRDDPDESSLGSASLRA